MIVKLPPAKIIARLERTLACVVIGNTDIGMIGNRVLPLGMRCYHASGQGEIAIVEGTKAGGGQQEVRGAEGGLRPWEAQKLRHSHVIANAPEAVIHPASRKDMAPFRRNMDPQRGRSWRCFWDADDPAAPRIKIDDLNALIAGYQFFDWQDTRSDLL